MKISHRLTLAALALALTALASAPKPAQALPICNNIDNRPCFAPNKVWSCTWLGGGTGVCICDAETRTWWC